MTLDSLNTPAIYSERLAPSKSAPRYIPQSEKLTLFAIAKMYPIRNPVILSLAFLFAILLATVPTLAQSRITEQTRLTLNSLGQVQVGMTLKQAETANGTKFSVEDEENPYCFYVKPQGGPSGMAFMMVDYKIARIDIFDNPRMTTLSGAKIGDSEERIKSLYPRQIEVTPHKYDRNGHYLTFVPRDNRDRDYRLIFETDGKKVTRFRSGKLPAVGYIEGCA